MELTKSSKKSGVAHPYVATFGENTEIDCIWKNQVQKSKERAGERRQNGNSESNLWTPGESFESK